MRFLRFIEDIYMAKYWVSCVGSGNWGREFIVNNTEQRIKSRDMQNARLTYKDVGRNETV